MQVGHRSDRCQQRISWARVHSNFPVQLSSWEIPHVNSLLHSVLPSCRYGTHVLLEACRVYGGVKRLIIVSTDEVFGATCDGDVAGEAAVVECLSSSCPQLLRHSGCLSVCTCQLPLRLRCSLQACLRTAPWRQQTHILQPRRGLS
jgi:hypothetical protein